MTPDPASDAPRPALAAVDDTDPHPVRHDVEAEMGALGCALLSAEAAARVVDELTVHDFYRNSHQVIYTAIKALSDRGVEVNQFTVRRELEGIANGRLINERLYLHTLVERVPLTAWVGNYIKTLKGLTPLRGMTQVARQLIQLGATTDPADVEHAVERAQQLLDEATQVAAPVAARSVADLITGYMESLENYENNPRGLTTGWSDLDSLVNGFRPGQLIIIGARTSVGKTVAQINVAHHVGVRLGLPVWLSTLEMPTEEVLARIAAHDARVNLHKLGDPKTLDDDDWARLGRSHSRLLEAGNFLIHDEPGVSVNHIRQGLRAMRRAGRPAALVVIDYLQLMNSTGRAENRQVEVSQFSRGLKQLAKEFGVPIVVGAQLNREVEHRAGKLPTLADLRESGSLENDADIVILLHRPDLHEKESPRAGEIDLIVQKNRNGPTATITSAFQGHYARIVDMADSSDGAWTPHKAIS